MIQRNDLKYAICRSKYDIARGEVENSIFKMNIYRGINTVLDNIKKLNSELDVHALEFLLFDLLNEYIENERIKKEGE